MTRKEMPLFIMLVAGLITALTAYFRGFKLSTMLITLLATLVIFYTIGCIIRMVLDSFDAKNSAKVADEGAVIEKEPVSDQEERIEEENGDSNS
jgi:hypothetical protein